MSSAIKGIHLSIKCSKKKFEKKFEKMLATALLKQKRTIMSKDTNDAVTQAKK